MATMHELPGRFRAVLRNRPSRALAVFSVLLAVAILALFGFDLRGRYRAAIVDGQQFATSFAEVLSEHTGRTFEAVDRTLHEAEIIRQDALAGRYNSADEVRAALRHLKQTSPVLVAVIWTDAAGMLQASSFDGAPPITDIAAYPHFLAQRDSADLGLYVSAPFRGASGRWFSTVSRRLNNP